MIEFVQSSRIVSDPNKEGARWRSYASLVLDVDGNLFVLTTLSFFRRLRSSSVYCELSDSRVEKIGSFAISRGNLNDRLERFGLAAFSLDKNVIISSETDPAVSLASAVAGEYATFSQNRDVGPKLFVSNPRGSVRTNLGELRDGLIRLRSHEMIGPSGASFLGAKVWSLGSMIGIAVAYDDTERILYAAPVDEVDRVLQNEGIEIAGAERIVRHNAEAARISGPKNPEDVLERWFVDISQKSTPIFSAEEKLQVLTRSLLSLEGGTFELQKLAVKSRELNLGIDIDNDTIVLLDGRGKSGFLLSINEYLSLAAPSLEPST